MRSASTRLLAVMAAGLIIVTAACGSSKSDSSSSATTGNASSVTTVAMKDLSAKMTGVKLVTPGTLTICSDIPYAPFEFEDNGKLTGFDVNLVEAMATSLGLKTDWKTTPFDTIIPALAAGNCDVIASATTITDTRKEQVNFTQPYFLTDQSLLVQTKDKDTYNSLASLANKTIGVQAGTTGETYANDNKPAGATVKSYPGADDLFAALVSGDIQAILQDYPVNQYRALKAPDQFALTAVFKTQEPYGIAVAKGNDALVAALDAALAEAQASGQSDAIYVTWLGPKR